MMDCIGDFKKSLDCYSGGRDHTPCCLSKGVHNSCVEFCKGTTSPTLDINHLMCVSFMNDISNCLMEGLCKSKLDSSSHYLREKMIVNIKMVPAMEGDRPKCS
jgi:hypothetical protein